MTSQARKPYLTDLTDEQWAILEPLITDNGDHDGFADSRETVMLEGWIYPAGTIPPSDDNSAECACFS